MVCQRENDSRYLNFSKFTYTAEMAVALGYQSNSLPTELRGPFL